MTNRNFHKFWWICIFYRTYLENWEGGSKRRKKLNLTTLKTILEDSKGLQEATPWGRAQEAARWDQPFPLLAFLNSITKNRITPTNSNSTRNDMVIINLSLL
jgi:hypothetical protein